MKLTFRIISFIMMMVIIFTTIVSCGITPDNITQNNKDDNSITDDEISEIVTDIIESIQKESEKQTEGGLSGGDNTQAEIVELNKDYFLSLLETYPMEYFAEELLINEISLSYDIFPAAISLSDDEVYEGYAFLDYSEVYSTTETGEVYFLAGFIPYFDADLDLSTLPNDITEIIADESVEGYKYVYSYSCGNMDRHFVADDKYVKYGVDDSGKMYYEEEPYVKGQCDESRGALYSYDTEKYVYDPNVGEYTTITAYSVSELLDYDEIEKEMNELLKNQDFKYVSTELKSEIYTSHDAMINYLQSLEEETFMGHSVKEIIEIAKTIDPMSCIEYTPDGYAFVNVADAPPQEAGTFTRWMTGITCGIVVIASLASQAFGVPAGVSGAIIGASTEIFFQVVVDNKAFAEVDYRKVAVSAVTGAISAYAPFVLDAFIGGAENAIFEYIDGGSIKDISLSFVDGALCGLAIGALVQTAAKKAPQILKKLASKLPDGVVDVARKIKSHVSDFVFNKIDNIAKKLDPEEIQKVLSKKEAQKSVNKTLKKLSKISPDLIDVTDARKGAKETFTTLGYDWDTIQKLKGNHSALEEYISSVKFDTNNKFQITTEKQLLALAEEKYLPTSKGFSRFFKGKTTTGDSYEWYEHLTLIGKGYTPTKDIPFSYDKYKNKVFDVFGINEKIGSSNRKPDISFKIGDTEINEELKVGLVKGLDKLQKLRFELYWDIARLTENPKALQVYKIATNADNASHMLQDHRIAKYFYKMMELFPDRVSVYLDGVKLSAQDVAKFANI